MEVRPRNACVFSLGLARAAPRTRFPAEKGAINASIPVGSTPLHAAALLGNVPAVGELIKADGDGTASAAVDLLGRTPLHAAATSLSEKNMRTSAADTAVQSCIEALVQHGGAATGERAPRDMAETTPMGAAILEGTAAKGRLSVLRAQLSVTGGGGGWGLGPGRRSPARS